LFTNRIGSGDSTMKNEEQEKIEAWVKAAADFHGHLGPFLVLGVRMGLIGLRELQTSRGDLKLHATTILECKVPFSCTIDGIQVVTQCTVGNGRLQIDNAKNRFAARFQFNQKKEVTVTLKPKRFEELKSALPKTAHSYKNIQLAKRISALPERELFSVETK
jgi:formylmethanofuran dehydrogenase subunit E